LDANYIKARQTVAAMMPKPQMLNYHNALNKYLELLLFCQQYGSIKVPMAINKSLMSCFTTGVP
jgi:hypothetical protein